MNPKRTWQLVLLALGLLAFIVLFERPNAPPSKAANVPELVFSNWTSDQVISVEVVVPTNQYLRVEKANGAWNLVMPLNYPASTARIESLLQSVRRLNRKYFLSAQELLSQGQDLAPFGLDPAQITINIQLPSQRIELRLGIRTPVGDQLYFKVVGMEGVFATDAAFAEAIPRSANDWRDPALFSLQGLNFNRFEVRARAPLGFELERDPTNRIWRLTNPTPARADNARINFLFQQFDNWNVAQFVNDNPNADLEPFGLRTPAVELVARQGTNDLMVVQFGNSPTNDLNLVYARSLAHSNVVLVPRQWLNQLAVPSVNFRDRRLISAATNPIDRLEVRGETPFALERQTNGLWQVVEPWSFPTDPELMRLFWEGLTGLEVAEFDKDVVTDFAAYGLDKPRRRYTLLQKGIQMPAGPTNLVWAQLDFGTNVIRREGTNTVERVYVRRTDEKSLNLVNLSDARQLPYDAYQLRDRRIWSFSSNEVQRLTISLGGKTWKVMRGAGRQWVFAANDKPVVSPWSAELEECVFRLGQLRADLWVDHGEERLARYGFAQAAHRLSLDVEQEGKTQTLTVDFGGKAPSQRAYAAVVLDEQRLVFEFPLALFLLYEDVLRGLSESMPGS